jgi:peptidyl-prolyl cis-trans isomerase A (cyclophilin A)
LLVALASLLTVCAAPRDPELEKQVLEVRRQRLKPPAAEDEGASPPASEPPAAPERPTKSFSGSEIAAILGRVEGAGATLEATFTTAQGVIRCRLDERAPQTVANFVGLATGQLEWRPDPAGAAQQRPFYDGLTFHRIVQDFIIQAGNPTGRANAGPGWRIARELGARDLFLEAGALAMIDDGDASHGSQLFITAKPDRGLGNTYAAFGRCDAPELVKAIANAEKKPGSDGKSPAVPVVIDSVKVARVP